MHTKPFRTETNLFIAIPLSLSRVTEQNIHHLVTQISVFEELKFGKTGKSTETTPMLAAISQITEEQKPKRVIWSITTWVENLEGN